MHALWRQGRLEILSAELDILPKILEWALHIQMHNQYHPVFSEKQMESMLQ